jgi:superfamily II DNA/RNA helicase
VHRIGRTARAGKIGKAISFATPDQGSDVRSIERLINKKLTLKKFAEMEMPGTRPTFRRYGRTMSFGRSASRRSKPPMMGRRRGR